MGVFTCQHCRGSFSRQDRLDYHLERGVCRKYTGETQPKDTENDNHQDTDKQLSDNNDNDVDREANSEADREGDRESDKEADDKQLPWTCPNCAMKFSRKWTLDRHLTNKKCKGSSDTDVATTASMSITMSMTHRNADNDGTSESTEMGRSIKRESESRRDMADDADEDRYKKAGERAEVRAVPALYIRSRGIEAEGTNATQTKATDSKDANPDVPTAKSSRTVTGTQLAVAPVTDQIQTLLRSLNDQINTQMKESVAELHAKLDARFDEQEAKYNMMIPRDVSDTLAAKLAASGGGKGGTGSGADGETKDGEGDDGKEPKIDIVCLAKGDYIKKLIQLHDGDEEKAMNYIKNVGIATDFLEGDFRLIKKIYFDGKKKSQFPIRVKDFKRNKLEYLEEDGVWVLDIRGEIVGKRLCQNIVDTLLIANSLFNDVIINEKDEDRKELLLDLFQINRTQAHILKLMERKTQGKLCRRVAEFINYCSEVQAETGSLDNVKKAYD